ncbi:MAG: hypothetical protein LWX01_13425 [Deltaproteobacteria bacterium]|nr:hypothetical protein [Deltaproteobacteria bacterium]
MDKKQELLKRLFKARYHSVYGFFLKRLGSSEDAEPNFVLFFDFRG